MILLLHISRKPTWPRSHPLVILLLTYFVTRKRYLHLHVPSIDDYFEHNTWNPLLELLFLEQANGISASYLVEIDLAKIALSCHFAIDLLCYKEEVLAFAR